MDKKHDFGPPPPAELGKNLTTVADARRWLLHPSNWIDSSFWIVKWDGVIPKLTRRIALERLANPSDNGIFEVIVIEQHRMKTRAKAGLPLQENFDG